MGAAQVRFVPTLAGQNHQRGGSQSLERMVRISSMNGPQSLELSVSITGIHTNPPPAWLACWMPHKEGGYRAISGRYIVDAGGGCIAIV